MAANIQGHGAPTNKTPGVIGQHYTDLNTSQVYICSNVKHEMDIETTKMNSVYEWTTAGGGSGSYCIYMNQHKNFIPENFDHNEFIKAVQEHRSVLLVELPSNNIVGTYKFYYMVEAWCRDTSVGGYFYTSVFESPDFYGVMYKFLYNITTGEATISQAQ